MPGKQILPINMTGIQCSHDCCERCGILGCTAHVCSTCQSRQLCHKHTISMIFNVIIYGRIVHWPTLTTRGTVVFRRKLARVKY